MITILLNLFSEPSTPGPLDLTNSDLDAGDKRIHLLWTASPGVVSAYSVTVLERNDTKYSTDNIFSASTAINFTDMKNGHRYKFQITSFSQLYDGAFTVPSDTYIHEIKTVVKGKKVSIIYFVP